jgi:DNA-binding transcriptional ArsR family regulator
MLQNYIAYRILQAFFDSPMHSFHLRELARLVKIGLPSVRNHVRRLEREGLVLKSKKGIYPTYAAMRDSALFKTYKRNDVLLRLHTSGLVGYLEREMWPGAVVLFGSAARGEDIERSDVDLLIVAKERELDLRPFEKALARPVRPLFEPEPWKLSKELLNNVANGVVVYGYLKVFK